jgi:NADPH-dependent glutamate synthase beta subunit-like oxidoreductase
MGGILRYVISEDRLPRDVLDWEIESIKEIGVDTRTGEVLGKDFTISSLIQDSFDFILLTTGGWDSRQIMKNDYGSDKLLPKTSLLIDFLYSNLKDPDRPFKANDVVIIGGGKAALKAVDKILEQGGANVTLIYPFSEQEAYKSNYLIPRNKNLRVLFSAVPEILSGDGENLQNLTIRYDHDELEKINLDYLLVDSARLPEMLIKQTADNTWETIKINEVFKDGLKTGIFANHRIGRSSDLERIVVAVGRGRRLARSIHLFSTGQPVKPEINVIVDESNLQNILEIKSVNKHKNPGGHIENVQNLGEEETLIQAERCLQCGLICFKNKN